MPVVSQLDQLLALDPEHDEAEISRKKIKIEKQSEDMLHAIDQALKDKTDKYLENIDKRKAELRKTFKDEVTDKLPKVYEMQIEEIKEEAMDTLQKSLNDVKKSDLGNLNFNNFA